MGRIDEYLKKRYPTVGRDESMPHVKWMIWYAQVMSQIGVSTDFIVKRVNLEVRRKAVAEDARDDARQEEANNNPAGRQWISESEAVRVMSRRHTSQTNKRTNNQPNARIISTETSKRKTNTQTHKQKNAHTNAQKNAQTNAQINAQTNVHAHKRTNKRTNKQM